MLLRQPFIKVAQRFGTFLPNRVKLLLKSLPWLLTAYRCVVRKVCFDPMRYHRYAIKQETSLNEDLNTSLLPDFPVFHLILLFDGLGTAQLERCVRSLLDQRYDHWQLHLFCPSEEWLSISSSCKFAKESRLNLVTTENPLSVAEAANSIFAQHPDGYISIIGQDGVLAPHALAFFACTIAEHPESPVFYADEDEVDHKDIRHSARFKPDWNPDFFYSCNYVGKPIVYKCSAVRNAGCFREKYGDWAEYDLLLRMSHEADARIIHIDHVLYSTQGNRRRYNEDSLPMPVTLSSENNPLVDYFRGVPGVVVEEGLIEGSYRMRWPILDEQPLVSLIIPTRNGKEFVQKCVESIVEKTTYANYEILLVDNQSDDPCALEYFSELGSWPNITVLRYDRSFNYSAINNFAVKKAEGSIIGLINNDIEVISPDWLSEMVSHALREDIGCVGAKLYYPDDRIQHGGVIVGYGGGAGHAHKHLPRDDPGYMNRLQVVQNYSAVTAACLVMRKSVFEEVGGLNEEDLAVNFNDTDLCLKVRAKGYRNLWTPYAELYHHESISRGEDLTPKKQTRYEKEVAYLKRVWHTDTWKDPAYNSNLSLKREDFALRELP